MNGNPTRYGCRASAGRLATASGSLCHMRFAHNNKETCRQKCPQLVPRLDSTRLALPHLVSLRNQEMRKSNARQASSLLFCNVSRWVREIEISVGPETWRLATSQGPQFDPESDSASRWASGKMALCVIGYKHKLRGPIFSAHCLGKCRVLLTRVVSLTMRNI